MESKNHWPKHNQKKWIREKTNPCSSVKSVFHFFDLWPRRRLGTQRQHGMIISVSTTKTRNDNISEHIVSISLRRWTKI